MNQELLQTAVTFFKEQHGTYESMKTQMLAGGISQSDIDQIYTEIKKLGLDSTVPKTIEPLQPIVTPLPASPAQGVVEVPVSPTAPVSIHPVSGGTYTPTIATAPAEAIQPISITPQQEATTPSLVTPVEGASIVPLSASASTAVANPLASPLTAPTPIANIEAPAVPQSNGKGLIVAMVLFIILTTSFSGVFFYATYSPESKLAVVMSQTLGDLGLLPPKPQPVLVTPTKPKVVPVVTPTTTTLPATTTEPSAVSVSATVLGTSSQAIATTTLLTSTSTATTSKK